MRNEITVAPITVEKSYECDCMDGCAGYSVHSAIVRRVITFSSRICIEEKEIGQLSHWSKGNGMIIFRSRDGYVSSGILTTYLLRYMSPYEWIRLNKKGASVFVILFWPGRPPRSTMTRFVSFPGVFVSR